MNEKINHNNREALKRYLFVHFTDANSIMQIYYYFRNPGGKSMLMSYFLFFTDAGREGECKQLPGHGCPSIRFCCSYQCANAVVSYLNMVRGRATGLFIEMSKDDYCPITFLLKIIVLLQYLSSFTMNNPSVDVVLDYAVSRSLYWLRKCRWPWLHCSKNNSLNI